MPNPRRKLHRYEGLNHARYLTCSCYHRLELFENDQIKDAFAEHLRFVQRVAVFDLFAWVVMPEHIHLLLRPAEPAQTVTQILRRLKGPFGRRVITRWRELDAPILKRINDHRGMPRFWQPGGGYDRNIFTDDELFEKINYIHANPVRRGLAEQPTEYRWSSAKFYDGTQQYDGPNIARLD